VRVSRQGERERSGKGERVEGQESDRAKANVVGERRDEGKEEKCTITP
jgi:hypothetical protein